MNPTYPATGRNYPSSSGFPTRSRSTTVSPPQRRRSSSNNNNYTREYTTTSNENAVPRGGGGVFKDASSMFASAFLQEPSSSSLHHHKRQGSARLHQAGGSHNSAGSRNSAPLYHNHQHERPSSRARAPTPRDVAVDRHRRTRDYRSPLRDISPTRNNGGGGGVVPSSGISILDISSRDVGNRSLPPHNNYQHTHYKEDPPTPTPTTHVDDNPTTQPPYDPPSLVSLSFHGETQQLLSTLQRLWDDVRMPDAVRHYMTEGHIKPFLQLSMGYTSTADEDDDGVIMGEREDAVPPPPTSSNSLLIDQLSQDPVHQQAFHKHQIALHIVIVDGERRLLLKVVAAYQRRARIMGGIREIATQYRGWARGHLKLYQPPQPSPSTQQQQYETAQHNVMNILGSVHDRLSNTDTTQQRSAYCSVDLVVKDLHAALDRYRVATVEVIESVTNWQSYVGGHNYCGSQILKLGEKAKVEEFEGITRDEYLTARQRVEALSRAKSPLGGGGPLPGGNITSPSKNGGFRATTTSSRVPSAAKSVNDSFLGGLRARAAPSRRAPALEKSFEQSRNLKELYTTAVNNYFHGDRHVKLHNGTETPQELVEAAKQHQLSTDQRMCLDQSRRMRGCLPYTTTRPLLRQHGHDNPQQSFMMGPRGWGTTADIPLSQLNTLALSNMRDHIAANLQLLQRSANNNTSYHDMDEFNGHLVSSRSPSRQNQRAPSEDEDGVDLQTLLNEKDRALDAAYKSYEQLTERRRCQNPSSSSSSPDTTAQEDTTENILLLRSMLRDLYVDCFIGEPVQYLIGVSMDWNPMALPGGQWNLLRCSRLPFTGTTAGLYRFNVDGTLVPTTTPTTHARNGDLSRSYRPHASKLVPLLHRSRSHTVSKSTGVGRDVFSGVSKFTAGTPSSSSANRSLFGDNHRRVLEQLSRSANQLTTPRAAVAVKDGSGCVISPIRGSRGDRRQKHTSNDKVLLVPTSHSKFVDVVPATNQIGIGRSALSNTTRTTTTTTTHTVRNNFVRLQDGSHGAVHYMHLGHPQSSKVFLHEYLAMTTSTSSSHTLAASNTGRLLALGHTSSSTASTSHHNHRGGGGGGAPPLPQLSPFEANHIKAAHQCFVFLLDEVLGATVLAPIQALCRGVSLRQEMRRTVGAAVTVQRFMKGVPHRRRFVDYRYNRARGILSRCGRGYQIRLELGILTNAVRLIQRVGRGCIVTRATRMSQLVDAKSSIERFLIQHAHRHRAIKGRKARHALPVQALGRGYLARKRAGEKQQRKLTKHIRKHTTRRLNNLQDKEKVARRDIRTSWEDQHQELTKKYQQLRRASRSNTPRSGVTTPRTQQQQPLPPQPHASSTVVSSHNHHHRQGGGGVDDFLAEALMHRYIAGLHQLFDRTVNATTSLHSFFVNDVLYPQHYIPALEERWLRQYLTIDEQESEVFRTGILDMESSQLKAILLRERSASTRGGVTTILPPPPPAAQPFSSSLFASGAHTTTNSTGTSFQPELPAMPPPAWTPPTATTTTTSSILQSNTFNNYFKPIATTTTTNNVTTNGNSSPMMNRSRMGSSSHNNRQSVTSFVTEGSIVFTTTPRTDRSDRESCTSRSSLHGGGSSSFRDTNNNNNSQHHEGAIVTNTNRDIVVVSPRAPHEYPEAALWSLASLVHYREEEDRVGRTALELLCSIANREVSGPIRLPTIEFLNRQVREAPVTTTQRHNNQPQQQHGSTSSSSSRPTVLPLEEQVLSERHMYGGTTPYSLPTSSSIVAPAAVANIPRIERMPQGSYINDHHHRNHQGSVSGSSSSPRSARGEAKPVAAVEQPRVLSPPPPSRGVVVNTMLDESPRRHQYYSYQEELPIPQQEESTHHHQYAAIEEVLPEVELISTSHQHLQVASSSVPVAEPPRLQPSRRASHPNTSGSGTDQRRADARGSLQPRRPGGSGFEGRADDSTIGGLHPTSSLMSTHQYHIGGGGGSNNGHPMNPKWGLGEAAAARAASSRQTSQQVSHDNSRISSISPSPYHQHNTGGVNNNTINTTNNSTSDVMLSQPPFQHHHGTAASVPEVVTTNRYVDLPPFMVKALLPHIIRIQRTGRGYLGNGMYKYCTSLTFTNKKSSTNNNNISSKNFTPSTSLSSQLSAVGTGVDTTALLYRPFLMGRSWMRFIYRHLVLPARRIRELERLAWLEDVVEPFVRSVYAVAPRRQLVSPRRRCPEPIDTLFMSRLVMLDRFQAACKQRLQRDAYKDKLRLKKLAQFVVLRPVIKAFLDSKRQRQESHNRIVTGIVSISTQEEPTDRHRILTREVTVWENLRKYWSDGVVRIGRVRQIQRVGRRYLENCRQRTLHYQLHQQRIKHQQQLDAEEAAYQQRQQAVEREQQHHHSLHMHQSQNAGSVGGARATAPHRDPRRASLLRLRTMAIGTIAGALKQWYVQNAAALRIQLAYRTAQQRAESRYERQVAELERIERSRVHQSNNNGVINTANNTTAALHEDAHHYQRDDPTVNDTSRISFTADTADHLPPNYPSFRMDGDDPSKIDDHPQPHHLVSVNEEDDEEAAAERRRILICQRAARVFLARTTRQRLLTQEMDARRKMAAIFVIMRWFQRSRTRRAARLARDRLQEEERHRLQGHRRMTAAERIQRNFRGFIGRQRVIAQTNRFAETLRQEQLRDAARVIVRRWRRFVARRHHLRHNSSELEQFDADVRESISRARMSNAALAFSRGSKWFDGNREELSSFSPINNKQSPSPIITDDDDGLFYTGRLHVMPTSAPSSNTPTPRDHRGGTTPRHTPKTATPKKSKVADDDGEIDWDSCMDPSAIDGVDVSPPQKGSSSYYDNPTTALAAFTPPQHRRWVPPTPSSTTTPRSTNARYDNDDAPPLVEIPSVLADEEVVDMWGDDANYDSSSSPKKGVSSPPPQLHRGAKVMSSSDVVAAAEELTGRTTTTPHRHHHQQPVPVNSPPRSEQRRQHHYSSARYQMRSTEVVGDVWGPSMDKKPDGPIEESTRVNNTATTTSKHVHPVPAAAPSSAPANSTINLSDTHVGAPLRDVTGRVPNQPHHDTNRQSNVSYVEDDGRSASHHQYGGSSWHSYQEGPTPYYPPTRPPPMMMERPSSRSSASRSSRPISPGIHAAVVTVQPQPPLHHPYVAGGGITPTSTFSGAPSTNNYNPRPDSSTSNHSSINPRPESGMSSYQDADVNVSSASASNHTQQHPVLRGRSPSGDDDHHDPHMDIMPPFSTSAQPTPATTAIYHSVGPRIRPSSSSNAILRGSYDDEGGVYEAGRLGDMDGRYGGGGREPASLYPQHQQPPHSSYPVLAVYGDDSGYNNTVTRPSFDQCFNYTKAAHTNINNNGSDAAAGNYHSNTSVEDAQQWKVAPVAPLYQRQSAAASAAGNTSSSMASHHHHQSHYVPSHAPMNVTLGDGYLPDSPPHRAYSPPQRSSSRIPETYHPQQQQHHHSHQQDRVGSSGTSVNTSVNNTNYPYSSTAYPYSNDDSMVPPPNQRLHHQTQFGGSAAFSSIRRNTMDKASLNTTIEETYVAPQLQRSAASPPRGPAAYNSPPPKLGASPHSHMYDVGSSSPAAAAPYAAMTTSPLRQQQSQPSAVTTMLRSPSVSTYPSIAVQGPSSTRIQRFPLRARQGSRSVSRGGSMAGATPMMRMPHAGDGIAAHASGPTLSVGGRPAERTLLYSPEGGLRAPPPPFGHPGMMMDTSLSPYHQQGAAVGNNHLFPAYKQPVDRNYLSPLRSPSRRRRGNH